MKLAIEWLNEVGECVANDMFDVARGEQKLPGDCVIAIIRQIQEDARAEPEVLLRAAKDALRSYQYGNASPFLADSIATKIEDYLLRI